MHHAQSGESYLAQELFNEAINEFRISMAMNPANIKASELGRNRPDVSNGCPPLF